MFILRQLVRALLINRLLGSGSRRRGYRSRGRGGFVGPFPYYSRRTRGGGRVTMSGCCLPIPLVLVTGLALGVRGLTRR